MDDRFLQRAYLMKRPVVMRVASRSEKDIVSLVLREVSKAWMRYLLKRGGSIFHSVLEEDSCEVWDVRITSIIGGEVWRLSLIIHILAPRNGPLWRLIIRKAETHDFIDDRIRSISLV
jgi:hypothetical protein